MDKIEPEVMDVDLFGQLDICVVIWTFLELLKWIWDDLSVCVKLRERSTSFMKKSWSNMAWMLDEIDDQDKDLILSSQYNITAMYWRLLML